MKQSTIILHNINFHIGGIIISEIFEALMILCFGISWPLSIYKSYRSRSTKGKSLLFLLFIFIGYASGIIAKIIAGNVTYVLYFYFLNFFMVGIDIVIFFRNKRFQLPGISDSAQNQRL